MNETRGNDEEKIIRAPNLPLLVDSLSTVILKVHDYLKEVKFGENPWIFEAHLKFKSSEELEFALFNTLKSGIKKYEEMKVAPVTIGPSGDTAKFDSLFKEFGSQPVEGKLYEKLKRLCEVFLNNYKGRLLDLLSSKWNIEFNGKVKLIEGSGRMKLPSLVRSINIYEMGRFSGLRDTKSTGPASKALFDVRADLGWWMLSHILPTVSMAHLERLPEGKETLITYVQFEPVRGVRYNYINLRCYSEILKAIEGHVGKTGFFIEDSELARLSLTLWAYYGTTHPLSYAGIGGGFRIRGIRLAGQRMQEAYIEALPAGEVVLLDARLGQIFGSNARAVAEKTAKLGILLQQLIRKYQALASELRLVRFAVLYRNFLRSLVEPGYAIPSEQFYELQRFIETEDWRIRFIGVLTAWLKDGLEEDEARDEAYRILDTVRGLVNMIISRVI
ncbi:MAG: hypothetical protein DSO07_08210 [Thermoproteota archaeon]|jgi:hypothetical protein|uniref:Type I-A CRISPR-associated protein Cas8a2/Csx9 n=1 Tax=Candidatus Methanodesulfokora washburnensis TaxID=2478471 RepID=A0A3R9R1C6_9CREN|nr:hypothetical protein [Candidatus Methanodesulfokores washburnensis]RSN72532.1 hypothetical protein D6D85_13450 [Candidatus Methanodesulfokores washburnensis]TDA40736.1 MAG: hypothetical protein DSO07_08210 [Candidatus Korarchaeota archaeon]